MTDDNPRSEDPAAIRAAMLAGVADVPDDRRAEVHEVAGRRDALAAAVELAAPGDTLLVAGKGHETGQEVAGIVHPFDDRTVLREVLAAAGEQRMIELTLAEVAELAGGELTGTGGPVTGAVTLDSRTVAPGDLFVAVRGERVDGHAFLDAAAVAGAVAALTTRPDDALPSSSPTPLPRSAGWRPGYTPGSWPGTRRWGSPGPPARPPRRTCSARCSPRPARR